jgi:hypothetical protein
MAGVGPYFPDSRVRFAPVPAHEIRDAGEVVSRVTAEIMTRGGVHEGGVEQFTIGVQLKLPRRPVANPNRVGATIPIEASVRSAASAPPSRRYNTRSRGSVSLVACMNHQKKAVASTRFPSWSRASSVNDESRIHEYR